MFLLYAKSMVSGLGFRMFDFVFILVLNQYQSGDDTVDMIVNKKRYDTSVISIASIFYRSQ